jgi:predicted nuclease of predicted toxin-antitoxin system
MKFLVDAQLPRRLARILQASGHDALHTLDLPLQNRTPDSNVIRVAEQEGRVVVSKDADFVHSHLLHGRPPKLLLISTGNLSNKEMEAIFAPRIDSIAAIFAPRIDSIAAIFDLHDFIELSRSALIVHR